MPPNAPGRAGPAFGKATYSRSCMRFELLDEVIACGWTRRHTETPLVYCQADGPAAV